MKLHDLIFKTTVTFSGLLAIFMIAATVDRSSAQKVRDFFSQDSREVLATVKGSFTGTGSNITAVKVRTNDGITLEIYDNQDESQKLIKKISIGSRDAFFNFSGRIANLAADDVDGDKIQEILVPMYDENLVAHLTILRYDRESHEFERL